MFFYKTHYLVRMVKKQKNLTMDTQGHKDRDERERERKTRDRQIDREFKMLCYDVIQTLLATCPVIDLSWIRVVAGLAFRQCSAVSAVLSQCFRQGLLKYTPVGVASQTDNVVRVVHRPFTASEKCSAKNTWLSIGVLASLCSSSHLERDGPISRLFFNRWYDLIFVFVYCK